jgi:hypothetical protein
MKRRQICLFAFLLACGFARKTASGMDGLDPSQGKEDPKESIVWYDLRLLGLEGQGWSEVKAPFDRLPAKAEVQVRPEVWSLSRHSAGLAARFVTDATAIKARWTLTSSRLEMPHMPATGVSGLDLYVRSDDGKWKWLAVGIPKGQTTTAVPSKRSLLVMVESHANTFSTTLPATSVRRKLRPWNL